MSSGAKLKDEKSRGLEKKKVAQTTSELGDCKDCLGYKLGKVQEEELKLKCRWKDSNKTRE